MEGPRARRSIVTTVETPSGKTASDENFPVGSGLIRADLRPFVHTFYNFARAADDIADNPALAAEDKVQRLDLMAQIVKGREADASPAAARMRDSLAATGLSRQHCLDLLRAFTLDATKLRYANWSELMEYCRYSASPVGRQVLDLHGEAETTWPTNDALCSALQVINHLQDCGQDYRNLDRVYIPLDHLDAAGASVFDLAGPTTTPALRKVLDALLDKTAELVAAAEGFPPLVVDRWLRCETAIIVRLARRLVSRLRRGDPLRQRVKLTKTDIAIAVIGGLARGLTAGGETGVSDADTHAITERVRAAGTSFYHAMRMLPAPRRAAMYAIYAFCRDVDDIADDLEDPTAKEAALAAWRSEIESLYAGRPTRAVTRALADPVRRYRLRKEDFLAVIDGMEMDARTPWSLMSMAELDLYCDRVASAVGRLSVRAFGAIDPAADRVAASLGRALQLTNILRDISEDAERGRVYLPREMLAAHGIPAAPLGTILGHPALPEVCAQLADLAQRHFKDAKAAMRLCPRRTMRPAAIMGAMYWSIFTRLRKRGWDVTAARPRVPALVKLGIVLRYGLI
jgi:squalene synthase HpnD/squalene synthase HpnC